MPPPVAMALPLDRPLMCGAMKLILYDYYRSSASYRVRIALNLKGADYERVPVNLLEGEQTDDAYRARNPQGFVPMLEADGERLTQSLAIIAWLDARFPGAAALPPIRTIAPMCSRWR